MTLARSHSKRLCPAHLAVALAGRLSACPLFFTAKRLHSAAHRLLRSSAPWVPYEFRKIRRRRFTKGAHGTDRTVARSHG